MVHRRDKIETETEHHTWFMEWYGYSSACGSYGIGGRMYMSEKCGVQGHRLRIVFYSKVNNTSRNAGEVGYRLFEGNAS